MKTTIKSIFIFCLLFIVSLSLKAQVGIGTNSPNGSSMLEINATNKGVLIPRVTLTGSTDATTIATPATSLLVYNTATTSDVVPGYYYNSGTSGSPVWIRLNTSSLVTGANFGETINWNSSTSKWEITGAFALALGNGAGQNSQGYNAVALGNYAGNNTQSPNAVALGNAAGQTSQGYNAIALGFEAGVFTQGRDAVALGFGAGSYIQGEKAVALGNGAGNDTQSQYAIAIGNKAGNDTQSPNAVALGNAAGQTSQGYNAVALGNYAGNYFQGANAIAIGNNAGVSNQASNSIVLNASGNQLNPANSGFFVKPMRALPAATAMYYNTTTGEISYLVSDARLKRNILTIEDGLNSVKKLNPVSYEYRESLSDSVYVGSSIGFLAQELKQVVPNAVSLVPGPDSLHAVDLSAIIPILVSAVKELEQKNEKLQTRLSELEKFQPRNRRKNRR